MTDLAHEHGGSSCSTSPGGTCTCGGECDSRPEDSDTTAALLAPARAAGCTITHQAAPEQLARIDRLRPTVLGLERRPGSLAIMLGTQATDQTLTDYLTVERACCSFLEIRCTETAAGSRVVFSGSRPEHESALALIAGAFDPATTAHPAALAGPPRNRKNAALLGALGVACLACLLPGLLAAGAAGSLAVALGGEVAVAAAVVLGLGAVAVALRRRNQNGASCGC